jgi:hypothetical protein
MEGSINDQPNVVEPDLVQRSSGGGPTLSDLQAGYALSHLTHQLF